MLWALAQWTGSFINEFFMSCMCSTGVGIRSSTLDRHFEPDVRNGIEDLERTSWESWPPGQIITISNKIQEKLLTTATSPTWQVWFFDPRTASTLFELCFHLGAQGISVEQTGPKLEL